VVVWARNVRRFLMDRLCPHCGSWKVSLWEDQGYYFCGECKHLLWQVNAQGQIEEDEDVKARKHAELAAEAERDRLANGNGNSLK
jgi:hypothetical protein